MLRGMPEPVREAVTARPRGPLRAVIAEHHAFRYRHVPPARHLGLPSPWLTVIVTLDEPLHVTRHPDAAQAPAERGWQCPEPRPPRLRLHVGVSNLRMPQTCGRLAYVALIRAVSIRSILE